jgi:hypothetical protein
MNYRFISTPKKPESIQGTGGAAGLLTKNGGATITGN